MMEKLAQKERCFVLIQQQINSLRAMPVRWDPLIESGATLLELHRSDWMFYRLFGAVAEQFRSRASKDDLEASFQIYLAFATLPPGNYTLEPGDVSDFRQSLRASQTIKPRAEFEMTEQHLQLLRHARGRWLDYASTLGIDPKRPYGDMTYFEIDMADILNISFQRDSAGRPIFSKEQQGLFNRLFADLPFSLSVFLKNASLQPGKFCQKPAGWGAWQQAR
jgi:hypothetical protein